MPFRYIDKEGKDIEDDVSSCLQKAVPLGEEYDKNNETIAKSYQEKADIIEKVFEEECEKVPGMMKEAFLALNKPYEEKIETLKKELSGDALKKEIDRIEKIIYDKSQPIAALHLKMLDELKEKRDKEIEALEKSYSETTKPLEKAFRERIDSIFGLPEVD